MNGPLFNPDGMYGDFLELQASPPQARTVSWQISTPRSCSKSSTCRSESGYRTYIITAKRMISGDVLKYRKGLLIRECYENAIFGSSEFPLTLPFQTNKNPLI